jgi:long-chain fatty acid transport protein
LPPRAASPQYVKESLVEGNKQKQYKGDFMKKIIPSILITILLSCSVYAGGFQLNEHGARSLAMGNAFTAVANDVSAIYWNGAGLTQLAGTSFMVGTTLIAPGSSFEELSTGTKYDAESQVFFPTHFFAAHKISSQFAAGIGFTSPFGLGTKWDDNWAGRYLALETELKVFTISPVVAYAITDQFSVSAGLVYSWADVLITQKTPKPAVLGGGDAFITLEGDDESAFGYNFGVMYKPNKDLSIGASFHSQVTYSFEGTAASESVPAAAAALFPHGNLTAELKTPFNLAAGVACNVSTDLLLAFDVQVVGWSSYDTLKVDFEEGTVSDIASPRLYDDSFILRLGGDYKASDNLNILAGIYYDKNPVKEEMISPSLPEGNRLGFSAGINYKLTANLDVAASYLYIYTFETEVANSKQVTTTGAFNGTYNINAHIASVSLSYNL